MVIESLNKFVVSVATRHPKWFGDPILKNLFPPAYDELTGRYNPDYVNPPDWIIGASALDTLIEHLKIGDPSVAFAPIDPNAVIIPTAAEFKAFDPLAGFDNTPLKPKPLNLPDDIVSYDWSIVQKDGSHQEIQEKGRNFSPRLMVQTIFKVPGPGEYTIGLTVRFKTGATKTNRMDFRLRDFLVVSIGDSMASGEGVPDDPGKVHEPGLFGTIIHLGQADQRKRCEDTTRTMFGIKKLGDEPILMQEPPVWQEPKAHRSYESGPSRAALLLESERKNPGDVITFLSFARSGSTISDGLIHPKNDSIDVGQLEEIARTIGNRKIDALVITVGVNDLSVSNSLSTLVEGDFSIFDIGNDAKNRDEVFADVKKALKRLPDEFDFLNLKIKDRLPNTEKVFITEYPTSLFQVKLANGDIADRHGCGIFEGPDLDIDVNDASEIRKHIELLNEEIRKAAKEHGWTLVKGIADKFAGHGYCSGDSFWVFAEDSCLQQGDFEGTIHPNRNGHAIIARQIADRINQKVINPLSDKSKPDLEVPEPTVVGGGTA